MAEEDGEKTEAPSQHKIDEARKKGDVANSKELASVLVLAGAFSTLVLASLSIFEVLSDYIAWLYNLQIAKVYTHEVAQEIISETVWVALKCVAPVFLSSIALGVFSHVMQFGLLYAPDVLQLKFDRVNPVSGMKRIFSMRSIVEVIKGLFKFSIVLGITYYVMREKMDSFRGYLHLDALEFLGYGKNIAFQLGISIVLGLVVVAIMDFAWQKYSYIKKLRMTKQQVKQEHKDQEGSPEVKQRVRTIQREMSQKRMMNDLKLADVIVTNPTHLSVAIRYDSETMVSPEIVAKGGDHLAMRIREIAKQNDIPIVENVPLARALYKTVKVGEGVPRSLYKAVAEILAFVYRLKKKKKALS